MAGFEEWYGTGNECGQLQGEGDDLGQDGGEEEVALGFVQFVFEERVQSSKVPRFGVFAVVGEDGQLQVVTGGDGTAKEGCFD